MRIKDPVSGISHLIGLIASVAGLVFLVFRTLGDAPKVITMMIYATSLILLYGASSVYHLLNTSPRTTVALRKFDHTSIFLLIAGCYTPVFYHGLQNGWRVGMLITIWTIALVGIVLKVGWINLPRFWSTSLYVAMGWIAIVPFSQLLQSIPLRAMILLFIGGGFYTVGAAIYASKKLDFYPGVFGFHEVWHFFVLAGSATHFILMYQYISVL